MFLDTQLNESYSATFGVHSPNLIVIAKFECGDHVIFNFSSYSSIKIKPPSTFSLSQEAIRLLMKKSFLDYFFLKKLYPYI